LSLEDESRLVKPGKGEIVFGHFHVVGVFVDRAGPEPTFCVGGRESWLSILDAQLVITLDGHLNASDGGHSLALNEHAFNDFEIDSNVLGQFFLFHLHFFGSRLK